MKLKLIATILFFLFCNYNISNLNAAPFSNIYPTTINYAELSRKELEKKIGRKLKLKERITFRLLKRQSRKLKKLITVEVELMDNRKIQGNFLKIENDSLYLVDRHIKEIPDNTQIEYLTDLTIIPLTSIKTIKKRPMKLVWGFLISLLFSYLGLLSIGLANQNKHRISADEYREHKVLGIAFYILSATIFLLALLVKYPKKIRINGNPKNYIAKKMKRFLPWEDLRK